MPVAGPSFYDLETNLHPPTKMSRGPHVALTHRRLDCAPMAAVFILAAGFVYAPVFRGGWLWDDAIEITT